MPSNPKRDPFVRWGPNVAAHRTRLGLSNAELARRVDVSEKHLSQIEAGRSLPSYDLQDEFARVLDVPVSELFPRTPREAELAGLAAEYDDLLERVGGGCS